MTPPARFPHVTVKLLGRDGNAMAIMGAVSAELRRRVDNEVAAEFIREAMDCGSYEELLQLAQHWVAVS